MSLLNTFAGQISGPGSALGDLQRDIKGNLLSALLTAIVFGAALVFLAWAAFSALSDIGWSEAQSAGLVGLVLLIAGLVIFLRGRKASVALEECKDDKVAPKDPLAEIKLQAAYVAADLALSFLEGMKQSSEDVPPCKGYSNPDTDQVTERGKPAA